MTRPTIDTPPAIDVDRENLLNEAADLYTELLSELRTAASYTLSGFPATPSARWFVTGYDAIRAKLDGVLAGLYPTERPERRLEAYLRETDAFDTRRIDGRRIGDEGRPASSIDIDISTCGDCGQRLYWTNDTFSPNRKAECCGAIYSAEPQVYLVRRTLARSDAR